MAAQMLLIYFGADGNSHLFRREGWSHQEPEIVWSMDDRCRLELSPELLPLRPGVPLRLEARGFPALNHESGHRVQRLRPVLNGTVLPEIVAQATGSFTLDLPPELLRTDVANDLVFEQPDASRPPSRPGQPPSGDTRRLAFAWQTLRLFPVPGVAAAVASAQGTHAAITLLIMGNHQARQLARNLGRLRSLSGRLVPRHVGEGKDLAAALAAAGEEGPVALWSQPSSGAAAPQGALAEGLRFPALQGHLHWPLLASDPRNRPEPLWPGGRYGGALYNDRIAAGLAAEAPGLKDGDLYRRYLAASCEALDIAGDWAASGFAAWEQAEAGCEIRVAAEMRAMMRRAPLFNTPHDPTGAPFHLVTEALLRRTSLLGASVREAALEEYRQASRGWLGLAGTRQTPLHPEVARRLGLDWCDGDTRFAWFGNRWTFREYMLRYIRWQPWAR
ncbi:hypothetical protein ROTAS13_03442 [Roseomonas sp. TAS13]|uniref:hypothetical protein n=1 Tax=Roseomonas sp. TAS13 TaxID=1926319 RepID=UPI00095DE383|nr:hypothetical protein [Roseomonas sp. TAS13]USQ72670.1 hypothetical protein NF552_05580 [Roseomonas mucosa]GAV35763.1 hypothetical protein ROTAS13_03442 [Roseomonas sp. TAS13]